MLFFHDTTSMPSPHLSHIQEFMEDTLHLILDMGIGRHNPTVCNQTYRHAWKFLQSELLSYVSYTPVWMTPLEPLQLRLLFHGWNGKELQDTKKNTINFSFEHTLGHVRACVRAGGMHQGCVTDLPPDLEAKQINKQDKQKKPSPKYQNTTRNYDRLVQRRHSEYAYKNVKKSTATMVPIEKTYTHTQKIYLGICGSASRKIVDSRNLESI